MATNIPIIGEANYANSEIVEDHHSALLTQPNFTPNLALRITQLLTDPQLAWKLRTDERVIVLERTNARGLSRDQVPDPIDFIVCDASFIGLETILPASLALAADGADLVALIKPQFEVGKGKVGKGGVVRDPALHEEVCAGIRDWLEGLPGWTVKGLTPSPVLGPKGNREFLVAAHYQRGV